MTNPLQATGELQALQCTKLRALLSALTPGNRFYTDRLPTEGFDLSALTLDGFSANVGFTTRDEWTRDQLDHPPFGTNLTFPLERYSRLCRTTGTTGTPMFWLDTAETWSAMLDNWARVFEAAGVTAGSRVFFAFSFGPFLGFWTAFESASRIGCLCIPGGALSTEGRLDVLAQTGADVLCCTPTYAIHLGQARDRIGLEASGFGVRKVIVAGEAGGSLPAVRERMIRLWNGAGIFDHHGMTEVGPVSYACPAEPGVLHVMESSYLAEVVSLVSGEPVAAGGRGELVLTTLDRVGSPLLRYRTGDIVCADRLDPCPCGSRELRLCGGIVGRKDEMVTIRGVNVFPSAVDDIVRSFEGIHEYEAEIRSDGALQEIRLTIEIDRDRRDAEAVCRGLEMRFRAALSLRVPVTPVEPGRLPRYELKARRWKRTEVGNE